MEAMMGGKERRDRAIRIVRAVSKGSILFYYKIKIITSWANV